MVDAAALGLSLPKGWSLWKSAEDAAVLQWLLVGVYLVQGWTVRIEASLFAPFVGPTSITVELVDAESVDAAIETGGITTGVMRAVPLAEARRVIAEWGPRALAAIAPEAAPRPLPARVETPHDYALVAAEYVRLVTDGERRPIHVMAEACGVSRNTMSARVRRARDQGFIVQTGTGGRLRAELSPRAIQILNEKEN
jgi:hypothetical protein